MVISMRSPEGSIDIHQTNTFAEGLRKCKQNIHCRIEPSLQSLVVAPGLFELVDLFLKYSQSGRSRVACLELGGERMSGEILSRLLLVFLEGFFEDEFQVRGGCCRCGRGGG